jgi:hypothetical protein
VKYKVLVHIIQKMSAWLKFQYVGQTLSQGHKVKCWYPWKGFVRRNTHVKYQCPSTYHSKDIAKVKVFNK